MYKSQREYEDEIQELTHKQEAELACHLKILEIEKNLIRLAILRIEEDEEIE